jgi:hypothetical protein
MPENRQEGETTIVSPFFGALPSDRIANTRRDVNVHFFLQAAIPVNYTSEFRELFEAIM